MRGVNLGETSIMAILLRESDYDPYRDQTVDPVEDAYWAEVAADRASEDAVAAVEVLSQCRICGQLHGDDCPDYNWFLQTYYPGVE